MKRYTTGQLRERLAEALDAAERGEGVIIERRGISFTLQPRPVKRAIRRRKPTIEFVDAAVEAGNWTWQSAGKGLAFKVRQARRA